jgi:HWE histidine kinase
LGELTHRVHNTLAVILAIAGDSARNTAPLDISPPKRRCVTTAGGSGVIIASGV